MLGQPVPGACGQSLVPLPAAGQLLLHTGQHWPRPQRGAIVWAVAGSLPSARPARLPHLKLISATHISGPHPARPQPLLSGHPGPGPASPPAAAPPQPTSGARARPTGPRHWPGTGGPSGTRALLRGGWGLSGRPAAQADLGLLAPAPQTPPEHAQSPAYHPEIPRMATVLLGCLTSSRPPPLPQPPPQRPAAHLLRLSPWPPGVASPGSESTLSCNFIPP